MGDVAPTGLTIARDEPPLRLGRVGASAGDRIEKTVPRMKEEQGLSVRVHVNKRRSTRKRPELSRIESEVFERWVAGVGDAKKLVADQICNSVRAKWGTAIALEAATGIYRSEISQIRHRKFDRFTLERLVRLLCIVDPEVEVRLKVNVVSKSARSRSSSG